jgi:hypothetical protein
VLGGGLRVTAFDGSRSVALKDGLMESGSGDTAPTVAVRWSSGRIAKMSGGGTSGKAAGK